MNNAISIRPELAYAMINFDRDCESRDFSADGMVGMKIYLHAGKHIGGSTGRPSAMRGFKRLADSMWRAGLAAIPVNDHLNDPAIAVWEHGDDCGRVLRIDEFITGSLFATARLVACKESTNNPWREDGPWHWIFSEITPLSEPIPCSGAQGVWVVPQDVILKI